MDDNRESRNMINWLYSFDVASLILWDPVEAIKKFELVQGIAPATTSTVTKQKTVFGKVFNPNTNRFISSTGKLAKKLGLV